MTESNRWLLLEAALFLGWARLRTRLLPLRWSSRAHEREIDEAPTVDHLPTRRRPAASGAIDPVVAALEAEYEADEATLRSDVERLLADLICLDVGSAVYPQLGLECVLAVQPPGEPRWHALLEDRLAANLCTPGNASAFLSVPGVLAPPDTATDWPAAWIAATSRGPTDRCSRTETRLSHVKLPVSGGDAVLKRYWGAGHVWRTLPSPGPQTASPEGTGAENSDRSVERVLSRAIAFVLSAQSLTGRWSDFLLPAGPSDEWVTAFVATSLVESRAEIVEEAAVRAWAALLARRRDEPGWGYNRLTPADADSTGWALGLAAALGVAEDEPEAAISS